MKQDKKLLLVGSRVKIKWGLSGKEVKGGGIPRGAALTQTNQWPNQSLKSAACNFHYVFFFFFFYHLRVELGNITISEIKSSSDGVYNEKTVKKKEMEVFFHVIEVKKKKKNVLYNTQAVERKKKNLVLTA